MDLRTKFRKQGPKKPKDSVVDVPIPQIVSAPQTPPSELNPFTSKFLNKLETLFGEHPASLPSVPSVPSDPLTPLGSLFGVPNLDLDFLLLMDGQNGPQDSTVEVKIEGDADSELHVTYQEENVMLRHFFKTLLPLLDAHPNSPWPHLALKYCDFDVARSCFISLACIHMYESRKGGDEYYQKGIAHMNTTMNYLVQYMSTLPLEPGAGVEKTETLSLRKHVRYFVILVLINVQILAAVLQKGVSNLSRYFFQVFATICQDEQFFATLMENDKKRSLVVVLSWYDTVCALVSPDCRLPYCVPDWYGYVDDNISTAKMMGCPGEILRAMSKVCFLRHEMRHADSDSDSDSFFRESFDSIEAELLNYRKYVALGDGKDYCLRLKGAQCWALAVYIALLRVSPDNDSPARVQASVSEFLDVYVSMPSDSPVVTQMVWPVLQVGCVCRTNGDRIIMRDIMDKLYETAQMGTLTSLRWVVEQVWERGVSQEQVVAEWVDKDSEYLPL